MENIRKPINNQNGFTLLEVMIAMIILAIALLALAQLQITSIRGNRFSYNMTIATSLASNGLEQMVQAYWGNPNTVSCGAAETIDQANLSFQRTCTISAGDVGQRIATVIVNWQNANGKQQQVTANSLL